MDRVEAAAGPALLLATRRLPAVRRILTTLNVSPRVLSEDSVRDLFYGFTVYFLHDELLLCGPELEAERVARIVRECAAEAARLLFGRVPVDFPVSVHHVHDYSEGK